MSWKTSKEMINETLITLGTAVIVLGFIKLNDFTPWQLIVSGAVILGIGVHRFLKSNPKFKFKRVFSRKKRK